MARRPIEKIEDYSPDLQEVIRVYRFTVLFVACHRT